MLYLSLPTAGYSTRRSMSSHPLAHHGRGHRLSRRQRHARCSIPNRLPEETLPRAQRDDAFAALELPISPHQAAIVSRKLVGPTDLNARIYSPKGTLIVDSETLFGEGRRRRRLRPAADNEPAPRLKNFWTRFHYWVINKELKVYRELGTANGFLYPEVKNAAQQGRETPILLLDSKGQQIVSMAEPIKRGNKILGVLLL